MQVTKKHINHLIQQLDEDAQNVLLQEKLKDLATIGKEVWKWFTKGKTIPKKIGGATKKTIGGGLTGATAYDLATDQDILNKEFWKELISGKATGPLETNKYGFTDSEWEAMTDANKTAMRQQADYLSAAEGEGGALDDLKSDFGGAGKGLGYLTGGAIGIGAPLIAASYMKKKKEKEKQKKADQAERETSYAVGENIGEGFAGALPANERRAFDTNRRRQSEVLGYKLTGKKDIKVEIDDATIKECRVKRKHLQQLVENVMIISEKKDARFIPRAWDAFKKLITKTKKPASTFGTYHYLTDPDIGVFGDTWKEYLGYVDRMGQGTDKTFQYVDDDGNVILNPEIEQDLIDAKEKYFKQGVKTGVGKAILPAAGLTGAVVLAKSMYDKKKKEKEQADREVNYAVGEEKEYNPEESYHYNRVTKNKGKK